jgi:hypothetical protein
MQFQPKSEQELQIGLLLENGIYDFQVVNASEEVSKSGNEMIKMTLKVWDNGVERIIFDYLLNNYKLKHFCDQMDMEDKYQQGCVLATDCIGKSGKAHIMVQKDKTGKYGDRNSVKDYVKLENTVEDSHKDLEDDLPF